MDLSRRSQLVSSLYIDQFLFRVGSKFPINRPGGRPPTQVEIRHTRWSKVVGA